MFSSRFQRSRITSELSDESEESSDEDSSSTSAQVNAPTSARSRRTAHEPKAPPEPPAEVKPKFVIRPVPPSPPATFVALDNGENHVFEREIWLHVFSFLTHKELCLCMRICRTWNRWCMDQRFWSVIDLSEKKTVTPSALRGIVRRQPRTLNLSWTNVTFKQLHWVLTRLPRLRELYISGTTPATVDALNQVNCPRLNLLSLSWSDGITDKVLKNLVSPPPPTEGRATGPGDSKSRLRNLATLFLSGCDVTGNSLRALAQHCPQLRKLDVSYCAGITDQDIEALTNYTSRDTLAEILLTGCPKLTDSSLTYLERCPCIVRLDVRCCAGVSHNAVEKYVESRDLPLKITDGKLVLLKA